MQESLWVEKYRPVKVSDCILPENLKTIFQGYVDRKEIPNLLLSGSAGVGKTTIAKALCEEVGCDYMMINGSDESGIDTFRVKIKNYAGTISFDGSKKVIIIDEADYLNPNSTQPAMRSAMEEFSHNCTFIMTCNYKNRIIEPLHSRCAVVDFKISAKDKAKMSLGFMRRCREILDAEGIEYETKVLAEVIIKHFPDYRRVINELQRYSMFGKIDVGILAQVGDTSIKELVTALREKNFSGMRKWVAENHDDPATLFRRIYDGIYEILEKNTIPSAVIILARYQYQAAFVADQELNMVACLTEMMSECEFI
jgi:DNA polymerase III delta prime subunit